MPYIKQEDRKFLDLTLGKVPVGSVTVGELNYIITTLVHRWLDFQGVSYTTLNAAVGVLSCAKAELLRRQVAPYEDQKISANGDLPPVGEGR